MKTAVLESCHTFNAHMESMYKRFARCKNNLPSNADSQQTAEYFWELCNSIQSIVTDYKPDDVQKNAAKTIIADTTGKWLFKSKPFWISYFKPYGYTGDFSIIELMYDLEKNAGSVLHQSAMTNCLDYAFSTIDSVQGVWARRKWLHELLLKKYHQKDGKLRVLDVACGGARYIKDFLELVPTVDAVEVTLIDQDPAAINFAKHVQLKGFGNTVDALNLPISRVKKFLQPENHEYDVIISSGLFDYLNVRTAQGLLDHFSQLLDKDGTIAITNFSDEDRSAFAKEWFGDWQLIYRNEEEMKALFPQDGWLELSISDNRSLLMAEYTKEN